MTWFELLSTAPEFALLRRADTPETVDLYVGDFTSWPRVADLPVPPLRRTVEDPHQLLVLVPYRQLAERGFDCRDDATALLAMRVRHHSRLPLSEVLADLPNDPVEASVGAFDIDDAAYAEIVRTVQQVEIGAGAGSNFVIRRTFEAQLEACSPRVGLGIFARLLARERGAYWTFLVHSRERTLVGATPERHVSLRDGEVSMTPISGTFRYPSAGPTTAGLLRFLADRKETDELSMVVDEELKMMGSLCPAGARVRGPHLREMARLAHTEYTISGTSSADVRDILVATMFAPTVIGSPLENACRVVAAHEQRGRGYYGGVLALIGQRGGRRTLDSAICLRMADIDRDGRLAVDVGATIVRESDPVAEAAETMTKASALLAAITGAPATSEPGAAPRLGLDPRVRRGLAARNDRLARFWLAGSAPPEPVLARIRSGRQRRLTVVDAEDGFTAMLAQQLRAIGAEVTVRSYQDPSILDLAYEAADAVVLGPGPGDPRDPYDPKIAILATLARRLLLARVPIFAVCLGHQVLASLVGLPLRRKPVPSQGTQREITFAGRAVRVGFYNTFAAFSRRDEITCAVTGTSVAIERDQHTGEVHGLRGARLASVQFHPESILTQDGPGLLGELVGPLVGVGPAQDLTCSLMAVSS